MKYIEMFTKDNHRYHDICAFAQAIYERELSLHILHFPDILFAVVDDERIYGCMGLNLCLKFPLFVNDARLQNIINAGDPETRYGEQSVLAIHNYWIGLPILFSTVAKYAANVGLHKVVYAAIAVSQKTIKQMQFDTVPYGEATLTVLPKEMIPIYKVWYEMHHPLCYVLDTHNADTIWTQVSTRFGQKVSIGQRLQSVFADEAILVTA